MDLIYMDEDRKDIDILRDYALDLAYGQDENDFECTISEDNHCCKKGYFLYIEGTEYGGIIDDIGGDTEAEEIVYNGRTWHGILNTKIIEPDTGEDYLIVSREANEAIGMLIERLSLSGIFKTSEENSGIMISSYKMNRYIRGYDGIRKMLRAFGAKLHIEFKNGFVELSAKPFVDYSKDEQFDKDQINFKFKKRGNCLNHVICLGKGDLAEREVIHVYADSLGNISETQVETGLKEVSDIYENVNAESSDVLRQGGIDKIKEAWNSDELDFNFDADGETYDIGDIVGAKEDVTDVEVKAEITKKIVNVSESSIVISYKVGEKI